MNRKWLLVLGGFVAGVGLALRRRRRRGEVEVEIEDPQSGESATVGGGTSIELESIEGIGPAYADRLREAGIADGADLPTADPEALATETDIAEGRIRSWIERAADREVA